MEIHVQERAFRFRRPVETAFGTLTRRVVLEVALEERGEIVGRGEAAPLEPYDGVSLARAAAALDRYAPIVAAAGPDATGGEILDACAAADPLPQALAAIDIALWDRAARRVGQPVVDLLRDGAPTRVAVNATVATTDPAHAAAACQEAAAAGYRCVKLKVGSGDDEARVAAARTALGPDIALRVDANGAWGIDEAIDRIGRLAPYGVEFVEEPVHGIDALRRVRERVAVRVAMDETTAEPGAIASAAADAFCLKLTRCGGISGLLAAAALVRAHGGSAYVASTFDGPIGIAAAMHVAAALSPLPACGLGTLALFDEPEDALTAEHGYVMVPSSIGLL